MSLKDIQKDVHDWVSQFEKPYFEPLEQMAQLTEEVGEVARVLNRMYGPKKAKTPEEIKSLEEELADAMFPIVCIANREGIDLQSAWEKRMKDRLYKRDNHRYNKK